MKFVSTKTQLHHGILTSESEIHDERDSPLTGEAFEKSILDLFDHRIQYFKTHNGYHIQGTVADSTKGEAGLLKRSYQFKVAKFEGHAEIFFQLERVQ